MISADFETNYDETLNVSDVWSAAVKWDGSEEVKVYRTLYDFMRHLEMYPDIVYFHNLKFDGSFILDYLENSSKFKTAFDEETQRFKKDKEMKDYQYKYLISKEGIWYSITIKFPNGFARIYDSFKKAPMSLKAAGVAFETKHQKLEMDFNRWMDSYTPISEKDLSYIKNDVYVLEEFLKEFENQGHKRLTIGSCALEEFQKMFGKNDFLKVFPNVYERMLPNGMSEGEFILKSYHGAFVYVNPYRKNQVIENGWTLDVNSLYPSVMHGKSKNLYPYGQGTYWKKKKPNFGPNTLDFVRFSCHFEIRDGYLPFVHIKDTPLYPGNRVLDTDKAYVDGEWLPASEKQIFVMQGREFWLFLKHYHVTDLEIIDGLTYRAAVGIFDEFINHFMEIKATSTGAKRTIAKLFLVNLYGKFATKIDSSFKVADGFTDDGILKFKNIEASDKKPGYIPIGSCITSNAMIFTLEHAQKVYHKDKKGFLYSDTDSIHGDGPIPDFKIDKSKLGYWDLELQWDYGYFVRTKSYLEVAGNNMKITCAGMHKNCKALFAKSCGYKSLDLPGYTPESPEEVRFLLRKRNITDFKPGLKIPGKLQLKRTIGGSCLKKVEFTMKRSAPYGDYAIDRNQIL